MTEPRTEPRKGWNKPKPDRVPRSTAWPAAMALGVTLLAWGLITSPVVLGVGVALLAISLSGWIGEIRHER
jgi:hypothetical protein